MQAEGGLAEAGEDDEVTLGGLHDGREARVAERPAPVAGLGLDVPPVGDQPDLSGDGDGTAVEGVGLATDKELHLLPGAGPEAVLDGLGIVQHHEAVRHALPQDLIQEYGGVSGAAAAHVVPAVHQAHGPGGMGRRFSNGRRRIGQLGRQFLTALPDEIGQTFHFRLGPLLIAIGNHDGRGTHVGHIRIDEPRGEGGGQDSRRGRDPLDLGHDLTHGTGPRVLLHDVGKQGRLSHRLDGVDIAPHNAGDEGSGLEAAFPLPYVGVGPIGDTGRDVAQRPGRDVGVQVEGEDDRKAGTQLRA